MIGPESDSLKKFVVAEHRVANGGRARLIECREVEEAAGNVADGDEGIRKKSMRVKVCETREDDGAPVGPVVSLESGRINR